MILSKDEYFAALNKFAGEKDDEETLKFIEDFTDTFNSFSSGENWEEKYRQNDSAWRKRYRERFFGGSSDIDKEFKNDSDLSNMDAGDDADESNIEPDKTIEQLFE